MKILISNDDGYSSPGLNALVENMSEFDLIKEINVLAPDRDRSGASNSLTLARPLMPIAFNYEGVDKVKNAYHLDGTPTDCVHVALTAVLKDRADLVISGINVGANLGDDVIYSGTVAAATEGRHLGLPALAVSLVILKSESSELEIPHFDTAAKFMRTILNNINDMPLANESILNINIPDLPAEQIKGIKITRLGRRHKAEPAIEDKDPRGKSVYWLGPVGSLADAGPGTDFDAVANGYISVTPLTVDLTDYKQLEALESWSSTNSSFDDLEFNNV